MRSFKLHFSRFFNFDLYAVAREERLPARDYALFYCPLRMDAQTAPMLRFKSEERCIVRTRELWNLTLDIRLIPRCAGGCIAEMGSDKIVLDPFTERALIGDSRMASNWYSREDK